MSNQSKNSSHGAEVEIRQVFEAEDFDAEFTPELREQEERFARADGSEEEFILDTGISWVKLAPFVLQLR